MKPEGTLSAEEAVAGDALVRGHGDEMGGDPEKEKWKQLHQCERKTGIFFAWKKTHVLSFYFFSDFWTV